MFSVNEALPNIGGYTKRLLFDKIIEIKERYWPQLPPADVLKENHASFVKGIEIVARRTIDLFKEVMKTAFFTTTQDEPIMDFIFTTRLYWFLSQMCSSMLTQVMHGTYVKNLRTKIKVRTAVIAQFPQ